jgi:site-specific DNA-methyltransferase (adenine-specific)
MGSPCGGPNASLHLRSTFESNALRRLDGGANARFHVPPRRARAWVASLMAPVTTTPRSVHQIHFGDNLEVLRTLPAGSVDLIYIDPPFNTGRRRAHGAIKVTSAAIGEGDRSGFGGRRYTTTVSEIHAYPDEFDDFPAFIRPRLEEAYRVLAPDGSFYFHIDYRESHYCKVLLDEIFGRQCFMNEIIWAYDYGGRSRRRWPPKHDTILFYVRDPDRYTFDLDAVERIPYMAPGLVTPEKAARGKSPTDTWWHTIVPTNGRERTGYPTQKPLGILRRIIAASSRRGDTVLDFFAGSGTTGAASLEMDRRFILVDNNPEALRIMEGRFNGIEGIMWHGYIPVPHLEPQQGLERQ